MIIAVASTNTDPNALFRINGDSCRYFLLYDDVKEAFVDVLTQSLKGNNKIISFFINHKVSVVIMAEASFLFEKALTEVDIEVFYAQALTPVRAVYDYKLDTKKIQK